MNLPCHECPVLPICLTKFNKTVVCDIVWEYVVTDTGLDHPEVEYIDICERKKRVTEMKRLFRNEDLRPEDKSDLL